MCQNHIPEKKWIPVIFPTARLKKVRVFWKKGTVGRVTGNENIIDDRLSNSQMDLQRGFPQSLDKIVVKWLCHY